MGKPDRGGMAEEYLLKYAHDFLKINYKWGWNRKKTKESNVFYFPDWQSVRWLLVKATGKTYTFNKIIVTLENKTEV